MLLSTSCHLLATHLLSASQANRLYKQFSGVQRFTDRPCRLMNLERALDKPFVDDVIVLFIS